MESFMRAAFVELEKTKTEMRFLAKKYVAFMLMRAWTKTKKKKMEIEMVRNRQRIREQLRLIAHSKLRVGLLK